VGARDSYPAGTFCWVDLGANAVAAAKAFYRSLFGWETGEAEGFSHCTLSGRDVAGVYALDGAEPPWTSYVAVEDVDAVAARVPDVGGTVIEAPFDAGPEGSHGGRRGSGRRALRALAGG
jgi:uncharacterized protein